MSILKIRLDVSQNLIGVGPSGVFRAGNGLTVRSVQVQDNFAPLLADEVRQRVELRFGRHNRKVNAAAFRGNADVALGHELHHAAAVIPAAVVFPQSVAYVPVVHSAVAARAALMSAGEVQPFPVRSDIAGLRPLVGPTEVIDGVLDVLLLLLVRVLLDGVP